VGAPTTIRQGNQTTQEGKTRLLGVILFNLHNNSKSQREYLYVYTHIYISSGFSKSYNSRILLLGVRHDPALLFRLRFTTSGPYLLLSLRGSSIQWSSISFIHPLKHKRITNIVVLSSFVHPSLIPNKILTSA